jgi:hypothetical protein
VNSVLLKNRNCIQGDQVNCTAIDYAYSHTVLENMKSDSDSTIRLDMESENSSGIEQEPGCLCFTDVYCQKIHHEIA